ncbi:uncharacterized protein isoform X1 [Leptinotarsa decemlineata]|uniref:uncharacterized protein isoform X1 n=2 Tax=Leptinotarsa decemlineata TaxID=7539 RepID=UPI003D307B0B
MNTNHEFINFLCTISWSRRDDKTILGAKPVMHDEVPRRLTNSKYPKSMIQYDKELSERLGLSLDGQPSYTDSNNNAGSDQSFSDKYSLRPRALRRNIIKEDTEEAIIRNKCRNKKQKQKAAPLSKYRRKTANARERGRMREINQAFETLRKVVPQISASQEQNEKLTKITTLRLAMKYISTLSAALTDPNSPEDLFSDWSELGTFLLESDGESMALQSDMSDHSLTSPDFGIDFSSDSLNTLDFSPLSTDLSVSLSPFDQFLPDFS